MAMGATTLIKTAALLLVLACQSVDGATSADCGKVRA
jgi:hypothetical protein